MLFRFTGEYTNGHTAINACGVVFHGHEPANVTSEDGIRRLSGHPEFAKVMPPSLADSPEEAFEAKWDETLQAIRPKRRRAKK